MSNLCSGRAGDAGHASVARGAAGWLVLAAAPTFAIMALLTQASGGDMLCAVVPTSSLTGMAAMYALMSVFHLAPWLGLIARRSAIS